MLKKDLKDIRRTDVIFARPLEQSYGIVYFIQQPFVFSRFILVQSKVGKQERKRTRMLLAANDRSLVRGDWLTFSKYQFKPSSQIATSECVAMLSERLLNIAHSYEVSGIERSEVENTFPQFFSRQQRVIYNMIKVQFKDDVNFTQQKKHVPL